LGGVAGLLLGGPLLGILVAGGAAIVATSSSGTAGKAARQSGECMAHVGDKLKEVDKQHHVTHKTKTGISKSCKWLGRQFNDGKKADSSMAL
jgi:hypothetical protein